MSRAHAPFSPQPEVHGVVVAGVDALGPRVDPRQVPLSQGHHLLGACGVLAQVPGLVLFEREHLPKLPLAIIKLGKLCCFYIINYAVQLDSCSFLCTIYCVFIEGFLRNIPFTIFTWTIHSVIVSICVLNLCNFTYLSFLPLGFDKNLILKLFRRWEVPFSWVNLEQILKVIFLISPLL